MGNFSNDLKYGQQSEKEFAAYLETKDYDVKLNESKSLKELRTHDLSATKDNKTFLFEIKTDRMSETTGNIAVEVMSIFNSSADYIVYKISDEFYSIKKDVLMDNINNKKYFRQTASRENGCFLVLFKIDYFKSICKLVKNEA